MAETMWTAEQQQVIDARGRNLLVSAAAGSGKTAVLVERILQMVTDREHSVDIDRLLVMTFTNAAAAEMRERIGDALEKRLEEQPHDANVERQATLLHHANITTIDSFCLKLIREHFNELDIDPGFRIGDEGELLLLQADVMKELLEEYYGREDERFLRFVDRYATGKADGGLEDYILQVWRFAQSNPWPGEWIAAVRRELYGEDETDLASFENTAWMRFLIQDVKKQAQEFSSQLEAALLIAEEEDGPQSYIPALTAEIGKMEELSAADTYAGIRECLDRTIFGRLAAARSKTVSKEKKELAAAIRNRVKDGVKKLAALYAPGDVEHIFSDLVACREPVFMLLELAEEFTARFQEAKEEKNLVDFNDLEHFALEILTGGSVDHTPGQTANELADYYEEILVDEYQDSNQVQETLIRCVSRERFGKPNVFMVGDVKQSIYRFRLAKPELFLEKYEQYSKEEGPCQKIELHRNFRSRPQVLASINDVFYRIMTKPLGNIPYTEDAALYAGAAYPGAPEGSSPVTELYLLNTGEGLFEGLSEEQADYTAKEAEARLIAGKIKELTDPETGMKIWNAKEGRYEPLLKKDIVILLRSLSGWAEEFLSILGAEGIPAFAESRTGYFTAIEVETVLNMLSLIDNPMQDIPLAGVLRSPIGGFDDRELAILMASFKKNPVKGQDTGLYGAMMHCLEEAADSEEAQAGPGKAPGSAEDKGPGPECRFGIIDDKRTTGMVSGTPADCLRERLSRFWDLLQRLRDEAEYLPVHRLIYRIFELTGYYDYVSAMPAGKGRQANLDMLVEKAAAFEKTSYQSLFDFIRYIEKLKKYNTDFGEAASAGENSDMVRIMSIHKSKGLEFPVVFLAGTGKQFNRQDARGKILIDEELGIATDYFDLEQKLKAPTLKKNVLSRRSMLESMGEELRILYVAMTRAREKLSITAGDKYLENRLEKWQGVGSEGDGTALPFTALSSASSCLDWLLMALPYAKETICAKKASLSGFVQAETESQQKKAGVSMQLMALAGGGNPGFRLLPDEVLCRMGEMITRPYPYEADIRLHAKLSVSELKERGQFVDDSESAFLPALKDSVQESQDTGRAGLRPAFGGAFRGTAYHRAFELLSFQNTGTREAIRAQLKKISEEALMDETALRLVSVEELYHFFGSGLAGRMRRAEEAGKLYKECQFVMGIPARRMGVADSDELVLIQGIIDAWFEEDDGLVIVDYKTDRIAEGEEQTLIDRYRIQLAYYAKALSQIAGKQVKETVIYSMALQREIVV